MPDWPRTGGLPFGLLCWLSFQPLLVPPLIATNLATIVAGESIWVVARHAGPSRVVNGVETHSRRASDMGSWLRPGCEAEG